MPATSAPSERKVFRVSVTAVFTALIAAATMVFSIYVPATRGYFNIGETMVYTTALLFGPLIGGLAGGVGSMISDIMLNFPQYAPGTLVIKATEGVIVGYLGNRLFSIRPKMNWKIISILTGLLAATILGSLGITYYSGPTEASIGFPGTAQTIITLDIPIVLWVALAALIFAVVASLGFSSEPQFSLMVFAVLAGGAEMVLGYFLYESSVLGLGWAALAEIPFNLGQAAVGLLVSIPLVKAIRRRIPFSVA